MWTFALAGVSGQSKSKVKKPSALRVKRKAKMNSSTNQKEYGDLLNNEFTDFNSTDPEVAELWEKKLPWRMLHDLEGLSFLQETFTRERDAYFASSYGRAQRSNKNLAFGSFMKHVYDCRRMVVMGAFLLNCRKDELIDILRTSIFHDCLERQDFKPIVTDWLDALTVGVTRSYDKLKGRDQQVGVRDSPYPTRERKKIYDIVDDGIDTADDPPFAGQSVDLINMLNKTNISKLRRARRVTKRLPKVAGRGRNSQARVKQAPAKASSKTPTRPTAAAATTDTSKASTPSQEEENPYGKPRVMELDKELLVYEDTDQFLQSTIARVRASQTGKVSSCRVIAPRGKSLAKRPRNPSAPSQNKQIKYKQGQSLLNKAIRVSQSTAYPNRDAHIDRSNHDETTYRHAEMTIPECTTLWQQPIPTHNSMNAT